MSVCLAARLYCLEAGADGGANRSLLFWWQLNFVVPVRDALDWGYYRGSPYSKCFTEMSTRMRFKDFVDRDQALLDRNAHLSQKRDDRVAGNPWQDCASQRRGDGYATGDKANVHYSDLFDEVALGGVEPEHVMEAALLGQTGRQQAAGVVASGFDVAGAAGKCANEMFLGKKPDRLAEVRAHRAGEDDEAIASGRSYDQRFIQGEIDGPHIEGSAFTMRRPVAIEANELSDR